METIEKSATIISKGVFIDIDYIDCDVTTNMLIKADGEYKHSLELELEADYIYFTWTCKYCGELIVSILNGKQIPKNMWDFKEFIKYSNEIDEEVFVNDEGALREIIVIMEQVFNFNPAEI